MANPLTLENDILGIVTNEMVQFKEIEKTEGRVLRKLLYKKKRKKNKQRARNEFFNEAK